MPRLPYAANTLISQAQEQHPRTSATPFGDADGFGVYRTIKFNKQASKWLAPLLDEIADPRVQASVLTDAGYLHVTFVPGPIADRKDTFPLEDAATVLGQ